MSSKLEQALDALRKLPEERQDELAEALYLGAQTTTENHTAAQLAAIDEGIADAEAGRFASDQEVAVLLARFRS